MTKEFIKSWHYRNGISSVRKGGRDFPILDLARFIVRLCIFIPFYICFYLAGIILFNNKMTSWSEFKLIRILGQLREFLRLWLHLPLKDPTF